MNRRFLQSEFLPGITHFFVDLICTALLAQLAVRLSYAQVIACAILYNCLAFAFQLPIGLIADLLHSTAVVAAIGCILVATGGFFSQPLVMCLLIGLGNACFHVGAGQEALQKSRKKAAAVGRFVAPGALGIFFGPRLTAYSPITGTVILLLLGGTLLLRSKAEITTSHIPVRFRHVFMAVCMFLTVLLRSYIGTILRYPFLSTFGWALTFSLCIFGGKFLGGILADRLGALRSSLLTQLGATVLLVLSVYIPILALPGILLFNTTMAVTATALYQGFPRFPGTMFGLTTLALFLGVLPRLLGWENSLFCWWGLGSLFLLSTALLTGGLILAKRRDGNAPLAGPVTGSDAAS